MRELDRVLEATFEDAGKRFGEVVSGSQIREANESILLGESNLVWGVLLLSMRLRRWQWGIRAVKDEVFLPPVNIYHDPSRLDAR